MRSKDIAKFLNKELRGEDIEIGCFSSLSDIKNNSVVFAKKYSKSNLNILQNHSSAFAIVCEEYDGILSGTYVVSPNPRLDYLRVIQKFFIAQEDFPGIHPTSIVENGAKISKTACIGAHCYIGPEVEIGENTIIKPNTSIYGKVTIGDNCYIKAGVSIGGEGFGFERDENGIPIHFPHCGSVIIGNNVYLGANVTVARATIDATIIEDNVKIDDLTLISHNCHIHKNTIIVGGLGFGGGTEIGENCWIAGSTIQKIKIGNNCKVCTGSVVLRNVKDNATVFGYPAKKFEL